MTKQLKVNIFAFITVLFWGSGFPFTRVIGDQISSLNLGFIRCFLAAVILVVIGLISGIGKPKSIRDCGWFILSGATGFSVYFIFFNLGLLTLTSSEGSVICATTPIMTAIIVFYLYRENINGLGWLTIITAFIGVIILLFWDSIFGSADGFSIGIGVFWMFMCAAVFAIYNVLNRVLGDKGYGAMEIVTWSAVFGAIEMLVFLPGTLTEVAAATAAADLSAIYLGVFPSAVAYYFWSKAIALADRTSEATNYLFINPLIATIIALIMLHEVPGIGTFAGGIIIIASVIVFSIKGGK
ncbi:MAG: DMT family transporter [Bacillota bacterium]|nr:DMT family transporter [Bacillota bacterium]